MNGFIFYVGVMAGLVIASVTAHYGIFSACNW